MAKKDEKPTTITKLTVYVNGQHCEFDVTMKEDGPRHLFVAHWKNTDPAGADLYTESSDIEKLKKQMEKKLEGEMAYEWQRMLYVEVDSDLPDGSVDFVVGVDEDVSITKTEAMVKIRIAQHEIAEGKGGRKIHRRNDGSGSIMKGLPETGPPDRRSWDNSDMSALVPDTQENREAIQKVIDGFVALRDRLADLLSPKNIHKTLIGIGAGQNLLPGPLPKGKI